MKREVERFSLLIFLAATLQSQPLVNPTPGPLHVQGNRMVDSASVPVLLRGTQISARDSAGFAYLNATTFSQMRLRWNMNVLRLQVSARMNDADSQYLDRVSVVVSTAIEQGLVVILAGLDEASQPGAPGQRMVGFWHQWAARFRDQPGVLFDLYSEPAAGSHSQQAWLEWKYGNVQKVGMQQLVNAIREAGARQPIIAMGLDDGPLLEGLDRHSFLDDDQMVYEFCPTVVDLNRDDHFGFLASAFPLIANDWDLKLDQTTGPCPELPAEPARTAQLVKDLLQYFDAHNISWTSSNFRPGKLIVDYQEFFPTTLNSAFQCGQPLAAIGLGDTVRFHLWGAQDNDVVAVHGAAGGMEIARGGVAVAYGTMLEINTALADTPVQTLGGASLQIEDASGQLWPANLFYVSPGSVNFIVPEGAAPGVATLHLHRSDGVEQTGRTPVVNFAPGLFTATGTARGPVAGYVLQPDGTATPVMTCDPSGCTTVPFSTPARVQLMATGIRSAASVTAVLGGIRVEIESAGLLSKTWGTDQITIWLDSRFAGLGEADLQIYADGKLANNVRLATR